jgi:hypothetical protein
METAPKGAESVEVARTVDGYVSPPRILLRFGEEGVAIAYWDWYYAEGGHGYRDGFAWIEPYSVEPLNLHYSAEPDGWMSLPNTQASLKSEATRTAPGDGSQHDTNKLDEAKEIIRESLEVLDMMSGQLFPQTADFFEEFGLKDRAERIRTLMEPREDDLQARARSFLKENGE